MSKIGKRVLVVRFADDFHRVHVLSIPTSLSLAEAKQRVLDVWENLVDFAGGALPVLEAVGFRALETEQVLLDQFFDL